MNMLDPALHPMRQGADEFPKVAGLASGKTTANTKMMVATINGSSRPLMMPVTKPKKKRPRYGRTNGHSLRKKSIMRSPILSGCG